MASSKLVWTSDPEEAKRLRDAGKLETPVDIDAAKQTIRVALDKKRRAGKIVTVATGFQHTHHVDEPSHPGHAKRHSGFGPEARDERGRALEREAKQNAKKK